MVCSERSQNFTQAIDQSKISAASMIDRNQRASGSGANVVIIRAGELSPLCQE
jgi:hypothetical protein